MIDLAKDHRLHSVALVCYLRPVNATFNEVQPVYRLFKTFNRFHK